LSIFGHVLRKIRAVLRRSALIAFTLCFSFVAVYSERAQAASCVQLNSTTYTQNFDTLPVSGTSNNILTLPTGFAFSEAGSGNNASYAASDGSSPAGDTYSFGTGTNTDRALGELTAATVQSTVGACFVNNTGSAIMTALVGYTGEQWRLGTTGGAVDRLDFQFSKDATSLTNGTWTNVDGLDFATPNNVAAPGALDGNAAGNRVVFAPTALNPATPIAANATFYVRWLPSNITGANDALAIDDFLLGFTPPPGLSGDFNSNNEIDAGDYVVWRKKSGTAGPLPNDAGISPGAVDAADYTHWRKRFGISAMPSGGNGSGRDLGSADVPEPASGLFLMAGSCVLALVVRRGRILPTHRRDDADKGRVSNRQAVVRAQLARAQRR
jgi:hypothetical protein